MWQQFAILFVALKIGPIFGDVLQSSCTGVVEQKWNRKNVSGNLRAWIDSITELNEKDLSGDGKNWFAPHSALA